MNNRSMNRYHHRTTAKVSSSVPMIFYICYFGVLIFLLYLASIAQVTAASEARVLSTTLVKPILCIGDSITRGTGSHDVAVDSYPALLSQSFKSSAHHYRVINYGVNGKTAQENTRMSYWDTNEYQVAMKHENVTAVIIGLGTNDAIYSVWNETKYKHDYSKLIDTFKAMAVPPPQVFLLVPPPMFGQYGPTKINAQVVNDIMPSYLMRQIGEENKVKVIDLFSPIQTLTVRAKHAEDFKKVPGHLYNRDGVHPNNNGYRVIADVIERALKRENLSV